MLCQQQTKAQCRIGQCDGRGPWNCARHIAYTVVNDTVHLVDWVVVIGHLGRFTASALVNGNVHNN